MTDSNNDGPEKWVPEAIAQQEEYLKRIRGCQGQSYVSHAFRDFGSAAVWRECIACGVTETDTDYQTKLDARTTP